MNGKCYGFKRRSEQEVARVVSVQVSGLEWMFCLRFGCCTRFFKLGAGRLSKS